MNGDDRNPADAAGSAGEASPKWFPTVGIGTSAGGVRALQEFFESLPQDVNAAFVVVVHLDPAHQSELPNILAARTRMPVIQVTGRIPLEPGRVYVIPPNRQLIVTNHHLSVAEFDEPRWQRTPIDIFFRSLAAQRGEDFAIVLSGAGSDGSVGIKAVNEAGGVILMQDPQEAEYSSMPQSAVATGLADFVLPVREIAQRLPELISNGGAFLRETGGDAESETVRKILSHLRVRTGHDFSNYKKATVRRRIARRMQVQRATTMADYLAILRESAAESHALFADLLISVTMFFRDPAAFDKLTTVVIPRTFEDKGAGDSVRAWIPGCATGEEAYSIAILLLEEAARRDVRCELQVFASDLDEAALVIAREGRYPRAIEADLTEDRLKRFFTRENDHYRVTRELRNIVLFARHSLLKDPPFSRADLVSCRNLLIYLDRELQQQICATFHFALKPSGYLFLGSSESADSPVGMFRAVDREARIFQRMPVPTEVRVTPRIGPSRLGPEPWPVSAPSFRSANQAGAHREALEGLAPPSAVVDQSFRVVHLSERAGRYLQPPAGELVNDITELAREELRFDLRAALRRVFDRNEPSLSGPIAVRFNGAARRVYLQAKPLSGDPNASRSAIVFFFEGEALGEIAAGAGAIEDGASGEQTQQLQQELQFSQSQLRNAREEYEGANEELRAVNEELQTVNSELKTKLDTVSHANSDIQNLMAATDVGILFLDTQLRIKRFTPRIAELFNVAEGDEGRSITDFTHGLDYQDLAADALAVLRDLSSSEREVRSRDGSWYLTRMRPYRTVEDKVDGVVVTFVDIGERRRAEVALKASEARYRAIVDSSVASIISIDERGIVQSVNPATKTILGYEADELLGANVSIIMPDDHASRHDGYLEGYRKTGIGKIIGIGRELTARRKDGSMIDVELQIGEWRDDSGRRFFAGALRDISQRKRVEEELAWTRRLESVGRLAAATAHDFNNLLSVLAGNLELILQSTSDENIRAMARPALEAAETGAFLNRRLLSLARRRRTSVRLVNLNDRIRETFGLLQRGVGQRISIHLDLAVDLWLAAADPAEFDSAVLNLVLNSRDAMPDGGEIKIQTRNQRTDAVPALQTGRRPGDFACLIVIDNGEGMKEDVLRRALDPFFTTKPEGEGAGLGLSAIDSFAKAAGGFVSMDSRPGAGTTVTLSLPRALDAGTVSRVTTPHDSATRGDGEVVLVVEDDDRVREMTMKRVEALGYVAEEARSADEARAQLTAGGVDLVLSDIVMPGGMDGVGLARWMSVNHPSLPIVLATAVSGGAGAAELRRTRDVLTLIKPYSRKALAAALSQGLSRARAHREETSLAKT